MGFLSLAFVRSVGSVGLEFIKAVPFIDHFFLGCGFDLEILLSRIVLVFQVAIFEGGHD